MSNRFFGSWIPILKRTLNNQFNGASRIDVIDNIYMERWYYKLLNIDLLLNKDENVIV